MRQAWCPKSHFALLYALNNAFCYGRFRVCWKHPGVSWPSHSHTWQRIDRRLIMNWHELDWIAMICLESLVDRKAIVNCFEMPRVVKQKHEGHWNLESLFRRFGKTPAALRLAPLGRDQTWGTDKDRLCLVGVRLFIQGIQIKESSWIIFFPVIQKSHSMQECWPVPRQTRRDR